jgi:hypothetical protein
MPLLSIELLGRPRISLASQPLDMRMRKQQALLAFLTVESTGGTAVIACLACSGPTRPRRPRATTCALATGDQDNVVRLWGLHRQYCAQEC